MNEWYEAVLQEVVGAKKGSEQLSLPGKSIVLTFIYKEVSGFFWKQPGFTQKKPPGENRVA